MTNKLPQHIANRFKNLRSFKAIKRRQIARVIKDFGEFQLGSVYSPEYSFAMQDSIMRSLLYIQENLKSDEDWGVEEEEA